MKFLPPRNISKKIWTIFCFCHKIADTPMRYFFFFFFFCNQLVYSVYSLWYTLCNSFCAINFSTQWKITCSAYTSVHITTFYLFFMYFQNLYRCKNYFQLPQAHKRQISLDLLRTMPNNMNFCDKSAEGVSMLLKIHLL